MFFALLTVLFSNKEELKLVFGVLAMKRKNVIETKTVKNSKCGMRCIWAKERTQMRMRKRIFTTVPGNVLHINEKPIMNAVNFLLPYFTLYTWNSDLYGWCTLLSMCTDQVNIDQIRNRMLLIIVSFNLSSVNFELLPFIGRYTPLLGGVVGRCRGGVLVRRLLGLRRRDVSVQPGTSRLRRVCGFHGVSARVDRKWWSRFASFAR